MKNYKLLTLLLSALFLTITPLTSCDNSQNSEVTEWVDYTGQCKFDANSGRVYEETTVHLLIDGDTTHFNVDWAKNGIYKARYLGVDTPESTGQIQAWGKKASKFTADKLNNAHSIIIESNADKWELDSTGERYTTWVWYQPEANADYRLLNLEIVQEGLSMLKNSASTIYGDYFTKAFAQAKAYGLKVAANKKDPDFFYGGPIETTISQLVLYKEDCADTRYRFEGLVTKVDGTTFYLESYDAETDKTYGMQVFTGYNFAGVELLKEGNILSVAGVFSYSDVVSRWQISDINYYAMMPNNSNNTKVISENNEVVPALVDASAFNGTTTLELEKETEVDGETVIEKVTKTYDNGYLNLNTRVRMENLTVTEVYTTSNGGSNDGAITLTCKDASNNVVTVRTSVLYDNSNNIVTEDAFLGKTIDVVGTVDSYTDSKGSTSYQLHAFFYSDITIK